jgi:hypothetical protein
MTTNQWIVTGYFALALTSPMRADTLDGIKASLGSCRNCLNRTLLQARLNYRLKMIQYAEAGTSGVAGSVPGMTAGARNAFAGITGSIVANAGAGVAGNMRAPADNNPLRGQTAMSVYVSVSGTPEINAAELRLSIEEQFRQLGINVLPHTAPPGYPVFNLTIKEVITSKTVQNTTTNINPNKPLGQQEEKETLFVRLMPVGFELSAELRRLVPGTTTATNPIRDEAIWNIAENGKTEGVDSIAVADEALKLAIRFVDAWTSVNPQRPAITFKPRPPIVPGQPPQSNQQEIGLLHQAIYALNQAAVDSLYNVHSSQRDMVERQLANVEAAGQQVLECQYGRPFPQNSAEAYTHPPGGYTSYSFWYPSAPPDILKYILSAYGHPFMRLGLISLTKCPSTAAAAERLFRSRFDSGPLANFREAAPDSTTLRAAPKATVESPEYLAWKKFPPGSKAAYTIYGLNESKPGTNGYTQTKISNYTLTLGSIDDERAIVNYESTIWGRIEHGPEAGRNGPSSQSSDRRIIKAKQIEVPGTPVDNPTQIVTRGEETLVLNGTNILAQWECLTRADDPLTFTKKWTSAEVPGGLVRLQQQTHRKGLDGDYRHISQTLYAPIDGVDARLGDGRPRAAANPARPAAIAIPTPYAPPPERRASSATSDATQPELMTRYRAVMLRASQARMGLAQAARKLTLGGGALPDEMRAAQDRLVSQQQAVALAMRTRDNAAEQRMRELEDTLVVIEKFVSQ